MGIMWIFCEFLLLLKITVAFEVSSRFYPSDDVTSMKFRRAIGRNVNREWIPSETIVSNSNPIILSKSIGPNGGINNPKYFPSIQNLNYHHQKNISPKEGKYSKNHNFRPGNTQNQYSVNAYPDTKSTKLSTFSSNIATSGGFKPINPPPHLYQNNPGRFPEHIRINEPISITIPKINYQTARFYPIPITYQIPINAKLNENYQLLSEQPQLHFHRAQPTIYYSTPFERIRSNVDVTSNKPTLHQSNDPGRNENEFILRGGIHSYGGSLVKKNTYEIPKSPIFNSYDETFGKYSKLAPEIPKAIKIIPQRQPYRVIKDEEDRKPREENEKNLSESQENYTEYEENGPSKESLQESDSNEYETHNDGSDYSNYGHDFEPEFDNSYQQEIPIEEYPHVKEVPEYEESASQKVVRENKRHLSRFVTPGYKKIRSEYVTRNNDGRDAGDGNEDDTTESQSTLAFGYKLPQKKSPTNQY